MKQKSRISSRTRITGRHDLAFPLPTRKRLVGALAAVIQYGGVVRERGWGGGRQEEGGREMEGEGGREEGRAGGRAGGRERVRAEES